jgi:tetratricopeptide (TPR) repeat protein
MLCCGMMRTPNFIPHPMQKTGRNDPCPCGSGKKYKQCCQQRSVEIAQTQSASFSIPAAIQAALAHHRAGRLPQAEAIYRQILQVTPTYVDALHLLGLIAYQVGNSEAAVELISKAISIMPAYAEAHYNLGNAYQAQGKLDEAIKHYHKALALRPDYAEAYLNIGNAFKKQGKLDEAVRCYSKARTIKPDYAEAHSNLGLILQEQGKLDASIESCRKALALSPDYAEAHNNLGLALHGQHHLDAAIGSYQKAILLKPDYVEAHCNLGVALREQGKLDAAVESYRKALDFCPDYADAYFNLGVVFGEQDNFDAAKECFLKAIALKPHYVDAQCSLGGVYLDCGDFATAETYFNQVLRYEPHHPEAWASLASLKKMTMADVPWAETAQNLLNGKLNPEQEMALSYALGKYCDDTRQYDAAFDYYRRANRLKQQVAGVFDRDKFRQLIDKLISTYTPEAVQRHRVGASQSTRPLFIVGMPRSGTSLTEQILASHPEVFGAGELRFWAEFWKRQSGAAPAVLSAEVNDVLLQEAAVRFETELQRHSPTALRVVDKLPGNFMHVGLIHAAFPNAHFLFTRRNSVDNCLSIYFQNFNNSHDYATDLDDLAFYYSEYCRLMAHWRKVLPPEVFLDVPYEALVEDQEGWSRRIIEFTGLEWDERCLSFHETERRVGTASNWQVRQKIYKTSKERWRNYERHVGPLLPLLELE